MPRRRPLSAPDLRRSSISSHVSTASSLVRRSSKAELFFSAPKRWRGIRSLGVSARHALISLLSRRASNTWALHVGESVILYGPVGVDCHPHRLGPGPPRVRHGADVRCARTSRALAHVQRGSRSASRGLPTVAGAAGLDQSGPKSQRPVRPRLPAEHASRIPASGRTPGNHRGSNQASSSRHGDTKTRRPTRRPNFRSRVPESQTAAASVTTSRSPSIRAHSVMSGRHAAMPPAA
jgi:hypothetical protein